MYLPAAGRIVALQSDTGKELWRYAVTGSAPSRRGVAYWAGDATHPPRIVFMAGRRLIELSAKSGEPVAAFGNGGEVDIGHPVQLGAARLQERRRRRRELAARGDRRHRQSARVRRADRRQALGVQRRSAARRGRSRHVGGRQLEGSPGRQRVAVLLHGRRTARASLSCRWRRRFRTPTVAIARARTCSAIPSSRWRSRPASTSGTSRRSITISGTTIRPRLRGSSTSCGTDARSRRSRLTTKSGYMYILNRETGQPIFGVEERPVAKSDVPGEQTFATQPFPVKPPPIARTAYRPEDLVTACGHDARARGRLQGARRHECGIYNAGPFTPWAYRAAGRRAENRAQFSWRTRRRELGRNRLRSADRVRVRRHAGRWRTRLDGAEPGRIARSRSTRLRRSVLSAAATSMCGSTALPWPCQKPPWGRLIAVNTVDRRFRVAGAARHHRGSSRRQTAHRPAGAGRRHRHRRRSAVHRFDRRQSFSSARSRERKGTLGDEARSARQRRPADVSRQRRQTVCRYRRGRYVGGVHAGS